MGRKARFEAQLFEGHKGVTAVLVPFDPEAVWRAKPVRLEGRRHGWLVTGTANGTRFEGYVGDRWGRFFIQLDEALCDAARVSVGDLVTMVIEPTTTPEAYLEAGRQSRRTTQPGRARPDAVAFPGADSPKRRRTAAPRRRRARGPSTRRR